MNRLRQTLVGCVVMFGALPALAQHEHHMEMPAPPAAKPAETGGLTLEALEQMALERNPTLAQAAAQIAASRGKALEAGLWLNPTIGYVGDQMGAQNTAGELQGGFIQQTIVTAGKLRLSRAKYRQEAVEGEIVAMGQQLRVANNVRLLYYQILAEQRFLETRREMLQNAEESLKTFREMFNTGQAGKPETLMAEVELGRAQIALRHVENMYAADWRGLAAVVGTPELQPTRLAGQLESSAAPLEFESSLCRLLQDSPQIQAAQAHVVHDQIMLQRERRQPFPDIKIQANTGHNYETNNTVAGVQVGIDLPVFDRNQGTIQQARADLMRSQAEVARLELSLRQKLAEVFAQYQTARQTAQLYHEVNVPRATEAYEVNLDMYKKRRQPWPRVVESRRDLLTIQMEYVQSLVELRRTETTILGYLLVDGLTEPPSPIPAGHIDATPKPR
jgi:cobalt-zinc-cadmium efflux system outer membrane protein